MGGRGPAPAGSLRKAGVGTARTRCMEAAAERGPRVCSLELDVCLSLLLCHFPIKLLQ